MLDLNTLEKLYSEYSQPEKILKDPVQFIYRYKSNTDRELIGFIVSCLAYGRVEQIIKSCEIITDRLGNSPAKKILNYSAEKNLFKDFKHRFNTGADISGLLTGLKFVLKDYDSLKNLFIHCFKKKNNEYTAALNDFILTIRDYTLKNNHKTKFANINYFFAAPHRGSSCKRLCLFMKWMIRKDAIDPGEWNNDLDCLKQKIIIPLDTHIAQCAKKYGMTQRRQTDWKAAVEITEYLKKINPDDPLKYDFAICHTGISLFRKN